MTSTEYRAEIADLGLTQVGAAKALNIGERTSRRYAAQGVPEKHAAWLREQINKYSQANKANGKGGESDEVRG